MKKLVCLIVLLSACGAFAAANQQEVGRALEKAIEKMIGDYKGKREVLFKKTAAVLDFEEITTNTRKARVGRSLSDLFTSKLAQTGAFTLVERKKIDAAVRELELGMTGLTEKDTADRIGRLLNADLLIAGTVTEVGENVNINVRLIEVETGEVLSARTAEVARGSVIAETKTANFSYVTKGGIGFGFQFGPYVYGYDPDVLGFLAMLGRNSWSAVKATGSHYLGVDFKYRIQRWLMFSAGVGYGTGPDYFVFKGYDSQGKYSEYREHLSFLAVPLRIYYVQVLTKKLNLFAGLGPTMLLPTIKNEWYRYYDSTKTLALPDNPLRVTYFAGIGAISFELGAEYFLSPRFALNLRSVYSKQIGRYNTAKGYSSEELWMTLYSNEPKLFGPDGTAAEVDFSGFTTSIGFTAYF
jgi:curli biogenesis system outer membrane secretion channel CsgG